MGTHPCIDEGSTRPGFPGRYFKHESGSTPRLNRRHPGVKRLSVVLLLLLFIPTGVIPQRYGKPYNFASMPQLLLEVSVQKETHYFSVYDLRKMPRSVVTETDPTTKQTHVYEGVSVNQLVPAAGFNSAGEIVEIEYGSRQIRTIPETALDTLTELIVVDMLDGKPLLRYVPYDFVAKLRGKPALTSTGVHHVAVKLPS